MVPRWITLTGLSWFNKVHSAAVLGSTSLLGTSPLCAALLLSLIQRINTSHNLPNGVFPPQKKNRFLQQGQATLLKSAWHLTYIHVNASSLNFKPAYYTSLKSDLSEYFIYYINTNEMPSEFSRENLISSQVKITCYLHMWKYHRCYGFIINRTFQTKKLFK